METYFSAPDTDNVFGRPAGSPDAQHHPRPAHRHAGPAQLYRPLQPDVGRRPGRETAWSKWASSTALPATRWPTSWKPITPPVTMAVSWRRCIRRTTGISVRQSLPSLSALQKTSGIFTGKAETDSQLALAGIDGPGGLHSRAGSARHPQGTGHEQSPAEGDCCQLQPFPGLLQKDDSRGNLHHLLCVLRLKAAFSRNIRPPCVPFLFWFHVRPTAPVPG